MSPKAKFFVYIGIAGGLYSAVAAIFLRDFATFWAALCFCQISLLSLKGA